MYLPLEVYFDDFEPNNGLGGHATIHKLGGIYVKLLCLPPYLASKLWVVLVAAIFHSEDRKEFNNKRILKPLIEMLLELENVGVTLENPIGNIKKIKIITCLVIGDNLGMQQILDFVIGFNILYCCRICVVVKSRRQNMTAEDISLLRKVEDYNHHVRTKAFGINEMCVFNKLPSFHIYRNIYADLMHDLLEGVCHYVFSHIFHTFIHDKTRFNFKITDLNYRILIHNFGPGSQNKPVLISDDYMKKNIYKFKKLPFTSSEMLTFTRHILLLLQGLIPDCIELELLRKLRNLVSLFFQHSIQRTALRYMKTQIEDFLTSYRDLYGDLQPKFHNLIHYPRIFEEVGPMVNISCFSLESVHQPLKKTAQSSNNQINLPVTLFKKIETQFCVSLLNSEEKLKDITERETKKKISEEIIKKYELQDPVILSKLEFKGLSIQKSKVINVGIGENDFPLFVLVNMVISDGNHYKSIVEELDVFNFNTDLCAYEVEYTNRFYMLNLDSITFNCTFTSCISQVFSNFYITWI